jgi:hypothetical protein
LQAAIFSSDIDPVFYGVVRDDATVERHGIVQVTLLLEAQPPSASAFIIRNALTSPSQIADCSEQSGLAQPIRHH